MLVSIMYQVSQPKYTFKININYTDILSQEAK